MGKLTVKQQQDLPYMSSWGQLQAVDVQHSRLIVHLFHVDDALSVEGSLSVESLRALTAALNWRERGACPAPAALHAVVFRADPLPVDHLYLTVLVPRQVVLAEPRPFLGANLVLLPSAVTVPSSGVGHVSDVPDDRALAGRIQWLQQCLRTNFRIRRVISSSSPGELAVRPAPVVSEAALDRVLVNRRALYGLHEAPRAYLRAWQRRVEQENGAVTIL